MTRTQVVAGGRAYTVSPLGPMPPGQVVQAIVFARLVDALSGQPLRSPARMTCAVAGLHPRATADAVVGLLGRPSGVLPSLRTQAYALPVRVTAPGYAARDETAVVAAAPSFPSSFVPADLGVLAMLPAAVDVALGTFEDGTGPGVLALGGVQVRVTRSWAAVDQVGGPASVEPLLAVSPGLSAARPVGTTVDVPVLSAPPEPTRTTTTGNGPGTTRLAVSTLGALAPGDILGIDEGAPHLAERVEVVGLAATGTAASAGEVVLRFPLQLGHGPGALVRRLLPPGPATVQGSLTLAALAGARTLVLGAAGTLAAGQVVRISGGASAPEYQVAGTYRTTTDATGAGRLPPLTGLAAVEVTATAGTRTATRLLTLTRPGAARSLDLTLR